VTAELAELARKLADWAAPATGAIVYLYGSRVRGDHTSSSDVDLCVEFPGPTANDIDWWSTNTTEDFVTISAKLGARVQILERNSEIRTDILFAPIVHEDRSVRCVWRKRHAKI
jgi:predicted nucleotidyltransferase